MNNLPLWIPARFRIGSVELAPDRLASVLLLLCAFLKPLHFLLQFLLGGVLHGNCALFGQPFAAGVLPLRKSATVLSVLFLHRLGVHVVALRGLNPAAVLPFFKRLMPDVLFKTLFLVTVGHGLPLPFLLAGAHQSGNPPAKAALPVG